MSTEPTRLPRTSGGVLQRLSPLAVMGLASVPLPLLIHWFGLDRLGIQTCGFRAMTGFACPSCGTTRAWGSLGGGDVLAAFAYNPVFAAAWFLLVAVFVAEAFGWAGGETWLARWPAPGWRRRVIVGLLIAILAANWAYLIIDGR